MTNPSTPSLSPRTLPLDHPDNTVEHLLTVYSRHEIAQHNRRSDLWVAIDKGVYDLTDFQAEHPGGDSILNTVAGKDATSAFRQHHRDAILHSYKERLQVGVLEDEMPPLDLKKPGIKRSGSKSKAKGFLKKLFKS